MVPLNKIWSCLIFIQLYNSAMKISSFHQPLNQSKYNATLEIAKLCSHWLIYMYKKELSIVWHCAGKKPDGIDFMSFSCQLSCGALSLKCWKFEKTFVCNCIPLFLWSFGFEYQSLELHLKFSFSEKATKIWSYLPLD